MSNATCASCKRNVRWSATGGARLRDTPCPYCGGALQGRVTHTATKGKHFAPCPVCGTKRIEGRPCWYHSKEALAAAIAAKQREGGAA